MVNKTLFLFFLLPVAAAGLLAQPSKFPPINDITKDKSLVAFVNQLKTAVKKQDKAFLISVLDENVKSDFGGDGGIEEFQRTWNLHKGDTSIWHHLDRVLQLGGAFDTDAIKNGEDHYMVAFPYTHLIDLQDADDYINIGVIMGKNVNIRENPNLNAKVLTQFSYDVVWFVEDGPALQKTEGSNPWGGPEWYLIESLDRKKRGWVNWKFVQSPLDFRLYLFKNKQGKWRISAFLAGD